MLHFFINICYISILTNTCLRKKGEYQEAKRLFEECAKNTHGNRFAKINIIKCMILSGAHEKDIKDRFKELLLGNTNDAEILFNLGRFYLTKKEHENFAEDIATALLYFKQVNKLVKKEQKLSIKARYNIGVCYRKQGKYDKAIRFFKEIYEDANKRKNIDVLSIISYGWCLQNLNFYKEAKEFYKKLLNWKHEDYEIRLGAIIRLYNNLGMCYYNERDYNQAIKNFNNALNYKRYYYSYYSRSNCYRKLAKEKLKVLETLSNLDGHTTFGILRKVIGDEKFKKYIKVAEEAFDRFRDDDICSKYFKDDPVILRQIIEMLQYDIYINYSKAYRDIKSALEQLPLERMPFEERTNSYHLICLCEMLLSDSFEKGYVASEYDIEEVKISAKEKEFTISTNKIIREIIENLSNSYITYSLEALITLHMCLRDKGELFDDKLNTIYESISKLTLSHKDDGFILFDNLFKNEDFQKIEKTYRGRILSQLFCIYSHIEKIKSKCRINRKSPTDNSNRYAHYTSIDTLKALLSNNDSYDNTISKELIGLTDVDSKSKPKFRLCNIAHMNDSYEGEIFLKALFSDNDEDKEMRESYFPSLAKTYTSEVYIASLSKDTDNIPMWRLYANEATGCAIIFDEGFFEIKGETNLPFDEYLRYNESSYPLYEVKYVDDDCAIEEKLEYNIKEIHKHLIFLENEMRVINGIADEESSVNEEQQRLKLKAQSSIRSFVANILNEVRFLFKSKAFEHENEVRVVKSCSEPKTHNNVETPRLYIEVEKNIYFDEVKLGTNVIGAHNIIPWLYSTKRVKNVTTSEKTYRKP